MNVSFVASLLVGATLLAAIALEVRDVLLTPAASRYTRAGSLLVALGLGAFFLAWAQSRDFFMADVLLIVGVAVLIVGRRRGERQPDRGWRRLRRATAPRSPRPR